MEDVARHAGVSRATVSRIVNGRGTAIAISESTRRRVLESIEKLGYSPNRLAQSLMTNSTRMIGLSMATFITSPDEVDDWHDLYAVTMGKIIGGVQSVTVRRRYDVQVLCRIERSDDSDAPRTNSPLDFVEGVIYASPNPKYDLYTPIIEAGIPLVMIGPNPGRHIVSTVSGDNTGAVYALTRALLRRGHRRIGLVLPRGSGELISRLREQGYRRACEEAGVPVDDRLIVPDGRTTGPEYPHERLAVETVRRFRALRPSPTAIIVTWSATVLGILEELRRQGLRCPDDIELVSYGDEHGFDTADPGITALDIRLASMGARAAELLFDEIEGRSERGRAILCPPRLRVRGSCPLGDEFEPLPTWQSPASPGAVERG